jgi:hypothetical protein
MSRQHVVGKKPVGPSIHGVWHRVVRGNGAYLTATRFRHLAAIVQNNLSYSTMSRFWAAESSSDDDQGSDSDASSHQQPIVRQSDRKFGSTFEESDSGK